MALNAALFRYGIRFTATEYTLVVTTDVAGAESLTFGGSLDPDTDYGFWDDATSTDLMALLETCLESHSDIATATVTLDSNWRLQVALTFANGATQATLNWSNGSTTLDDATFGDNGDSTTGATLTSDFMPKGLLRFKRPPVTDDRPRQPKIGGTVMSLSGKIRSSTIATPAKRRFMEFDHLNQTEALIEYATAPDDQGFSTVEYWWLNSGQPGYAFRYYPDETDSATYAGPYKLAPPQEDPLRRSGQHPSVRWQCWVDMVVAV